jgi:hypothetical protein
MCISSTFQALNDLVKPGGRIVYNGTTNRYELHPVERTVGKGVFAVLFDRECIARAPGEAAVYVITDKGRAQWERAPEAVSISGVCDNCDVNTQVRPKRLGPECLYLCGRCVAKLAEEVSGLKASPAAA